ncbi:MAG TPA: hypothetical protein VGI73_12950 [Solirubrobacterales bacterium]|jgi:hypothetical protein
MNRRLILIAGAASLLAALVLAAGASGSREVVQVGNLFLADNGGLTPSKLPKRERAPVTARLIGEIGTTDGSHPPALRSVDIDVDRSVAVDARGIPTCRLSQLTARSTADAKAACRDAIVGSGEAEVEVAFPEQQPFSSTGPLVLFNGGVSGSTTTFLLHAYVSVPAPTAIVTVAKLTSIHQGKFGLNITATIPRIAGGAGSVTRFELKVGRRFIYHGHPQSLLTANCPSGHYTTKGRATFSDGTELGVDHVFPCTPVG